MTENYAANLRRACNTRPSVALICREISINRQQFNRYLSGQTMPSRHNGERISQYFGVPEPVFHLSPERFERALTEQRRPATQGLVLRNAFPGDLRRLRDYIGYYELYHKSLSWPGMIVRSCARIWQNDDVMLVKSVEKMADAREGIRQFSKYQGQVAYWRNRLFIIECGMHQESFIAETILMPFAEHQRTYLCGITTGVSWRRENLPYATRSVWRALGIAPDLRRLLRNCTVLPENSSHIPPFVSRYMNGGPQAQVISAD
ncbi:transcriptional regulator [Paenirhodobacter populi]|uniref:transcriptional regulator n=1 Tax=Paenirhodobacter populi TaxID=2306993 RepID=UPI000FE31776|nr:transcriptional regulator [Sinirhodobacter populi]RWR07130.1 transcriptional regulator [Sinirhodobacter populi]